MSDDGPLLEDPWAECPGGSPYVALSLAGIGAGSSLDEIRDGFFGLMEDGLSDDVMRTAYSRLRSARRRLIVDLTLFDHRASQDLAELVANPPDALIEREDLARDLPLAWDV